MESGKVDIIIDSSKERLIVALISNAGNDIYIGQKNRRHASTILSEIENILIKNNKKKTDIDTIGVVVGPGSFTGIRIGVSTVNALAYAKQSNIVTIDALEAILGLEEVGVSVIDAGNGNYYALRRKSINDNYYHMATNEDLNRYSSHSKIYFETDKTIDDLILVFKRKKARCIFAQRAIPFYIRETSADRLIMSRYTLKEMDNCDIKQISKLEKELFKDYWTYEMLNNYLSNHRWITASIKIEGESVLAGYLIYLHISEDEIEILRIGVKKEFQGAGIAMALVEELTSKTQEKAISSILLEVADDNVPAIRLYEKLGFIREGIRKNYYDNNKDALLYRKKLI